MSSQTTLILDNFLGSGAYKGRAYKGPLYVLEFVLSPSLYFYSIVSLEKSQRKKQKLQLYIQIKGNVEFCTNDTKIIINILYNV